MHASDMVTKHQFPPWLTRFGCDYQYTEDPIITGILVMGSPPQLGFLLLKFMLQGNSQRRT